MGTQPQFNRWLVVLGAILIQLCLGAIYAWSVYTPALTAKTAAQLAQEEAAAKVVEQAPAPVIEQPEVENVPVNQPTGAAGEPGTTPTPVGEDKTVESGGMVKPGSTGETGATGTVPPDASGNATPAQPAPGGEPPKTEEPPAGLVTPTSPATQTPATQPAQVPPAVKEKPKPGLYGCSTKESQWPFSIGLVTFAIVMVLAGNWQKKVGPKKVALTGGILLGLGYILAGLVGSTVTAQIILIGLVGGAGIGLAYVCPIAVGVKWFPDKKGLITGLAVAGFGFGATIWVMLAKGIKTIAFPGLLNMLHFSFANDCGVRSTWFVYGIVYLILVSIGSIWMVNPPDGYKPKGWTPPPAAKAATTGGIEFGQFRMLSTLQFYMIWFCFIAGAAAGLMVIGVIALFGTDALMVSGMAKVDAEGAAAIAMGVFYALFNGLGRIIWGVVSDKIGRKPSIFLMCLIQGIAMLLFFFVGGTVWGLWLMAALIGFNFGGNFALYPAATADYFGNKNVGVNYGWMFTAYGVGGLLGPQIAAYFKDGATELVKNTTDQLKLIADQTSPQALDLLHKIASTRYEAWHMPFMIAGIASIVAAAVILLTQKPKAKSTEAG